MNIKSFILLFCITSFSWAQSPAFGTKNHPMNRSTPNMKILTYWNDVKASDTLIYHAALNIFSSKREASYKHLLLDNNYNSLIKKYNKVILGSPIIGNVSPQNISIWLRTAKPSKVQIVYYNSTKSYSSESVHSSLTGDLSAIIKLKNLKPETKYTYKIIINDTITITNKNYHFTTVSKDNIRIAFGSCPHRWGLGNKQLFKTIKERKPTAMLLLGDISVQDRFNNIGMHRADYLLRDFQTAWGSFASNTPIYASWDDHDYFGNDKAGIPKGYTQKDKDDVSEIFRNSWNNPYYGLGEKNRGIFFKTEIGSCDLIMTDNRYFRSGKKGSFLGEKQMNWLKEQIISCKNPFIIISCGSMWSDFVSNGKDSWGKKDPKGREEIFKLIEDKNISGIVFISGDRHGARGFTIQRDNGFKFYEFEAASLGGRRGPPVENPNWTSRLYGIDETFAFGELTFNKNAKDKEVTYKLIKEDGTILYDLTIPLSDLTPNK